MCLFILRNVFFTLIVHVSIIAFTFTAFSSHSYLHQTEHTWIIMRLGGEHLEQAPPPSWWKHLSFRMEALCIHINEREINQGEEKLSAENHTFLFVLIT